MITNRLWTVFGWLLHIEDHSESAQRRKASVGKSSRKRRDGGPNPLSIRNFPIQGNGAEMLRLACCLATEREIQVCAPVHDALLIEAPLERLDDAVVKTRAAMKEASEIVLDGFGIGTDVKMVVYPDRYVDKRGKKMWDTVWQTIAEHETRPLASAPPVHP